MKDPVAQGTRSHRGHGPIKRAEKCHPAPGTGGHEFQMPLRRGVEQEMIRLAVGLE